MVSGKIILPRVGAWHADLVVDGDRVTKGRASIAYADGGIQLTGTVRYGGTSDGNGEVNIIGGNAGLGVAMPPQSYRNATRGTVLGDILSAAGEQLSETSDQGWLNTQLPFWNRMRGTAGSSMELLLAVAGGVSWRVLGNGKLWVGSESWPAQSMKLDVQKINPRSNSIEFDSDLPNLAPGSSIGGQHVSTVEHYFDASTRNCVVYFESQAGP